MSKKIAFVSSSIEYTQNILPFARRLESAGFQVYWVSFRRYEALYLKRNGISPLRILETLPFEQARYIHEIQLDSLISLEEHSNLTVNDIILMDRLLRKKPYLFALSYLAHLEKTVTRFLLENEIPFVSGGRDTALQILTLLLCRKHGILYVTPSLTRLPRERFGFCPSYNDSGMLPVREVSLEDEELAEHFHKEFLQDKAKPLYYLSVARFWDVLLRLPLHAQLFVKAIYYSVYDRGNDFTRYTIPSLIKMYLQRRLNLLSIKLAKPFDSVGERPYVMYALHMQPESSIDVFGSFFSDQLALITQIARSTPLSHDIYVKAHPSDVDGWPSSFYQRLKRTPGVKVISPHVDSRELLKRASIVLTVSGTLAYEAGLLQKPAITFAQNFFNSLPTVYYCDSSQKLPTLIAKILANQHSPKDYTAEIRQFLATLLAASFPGQIDGYARPFNPSDIDCLQAAYETIARTKVQAVRQ